MSFVAFNYGANVIAFRKKGINYGMTCAWAMQVDYDKILCLMGSQSVSGHVICKGDIIGVSALSDKQEDISFKFGTKHSDSFDKFDDVLYTIDEGAILIDGACNMMKCVVIDVLHLEGIEEDNLVYLRIIDSKINDNSSFYQFKK